MIKEILTPFARAILLIALQLLVLNNIELGGYINPYLYILVILLLPTDLPGWLQLIISFFTGFIIDLYSVTPGMHTFASVALGYFRFTLLKYMAPREGYNKKLTPSAQELGLAWYFRYTLILTTIHHTILFFIESFSFQNFFQTLLRIILSIAFTELCIIIFEYFRGTARSSQLSN